MKGVIIKGIDLLDVPRKANSSLEESFNFSYLFFLHGRNIFNVK